MSKITKTKKVTSKPTTVFQSEVAQKPPTAARSQATEKLALLKAQTFTESGRQQRIARSLAALNAPQPTNLTAAKWKEIVEEVEDEG